MGVQGLWSVLNGRGAHARWDARVEDGRDLLIVDSSGLEFLVVQTGLPDALLELHTVGKHAQHASCLRAWLTAWLERGFSLLLVLDGSMRMGHLDTFVGRRRRSLATNGVLSLGELDELRRKLRHAREEEYEPYVDGDGVRKPPLFDAVFAAVLAELRAEWEGRIAALTAERDADVLVAALYRRERARVAAVLSPDSDFFLFRVERLVNVRDTAALLDGSPAAPLALRMYGAAGSVGRAVLEHAKAEAEQRRPELAYQGVGLVGAKALLDEWPAGEAGCRLLEEVAACLGNDASWVVREAAGGKKFSPWLVIRHLLAKVAVQRGWRDGSGRARQKLFSDLRLDGVVRRWAEYCAARDEYAHVPAAEALLMAAEPFAQRLGLGAQQGGERRAFLAALCCDYPLGGRQWAPRVVREWLGCGLGAMASTGAESAVYAALLPLRALVVRALCEFLAPPPSGWAVHELSQDARFCVALHAHHRAAAPEGCFVPVAALALAPAAPLPLLLARTADERVGAVAAALGSVALAAEGEEDEDDWEALADGGELPELGAAEASRRAEAPDGLPGLQQLLAGLGLIAESSAAALAPPARHAKGGASISSAPDGGAAAERVRALSCTVLEHLRAKERGQARGGETGAQAGQEPLPLRPSNLFCIGEHILLLALASSERFPLCVLLDVVRALSSAVAEETQLHHRGRRPTARV